jgi:hypothetical protein
MSNIILPNQNSSYIPTKVQASSIPKLEVRQWVNKDYPGTLVKSGCKGREVILVFLDIQE